METFSKNIKLNEKEELRAEIKSGPGRSSVDLRVWTAAKADEPKWPTGKGFLIPASCWPEMERMVVDLGLKLGAPVVHE